MKFAFLTLLFATAVGHNWMEKPISRNGNRASTATPCPGGADPTIAQGQVEKGVPFTVQWTINHGGDVHWVKVTSLGNEAMLETMPKTDLIVSEVYPEKTASSQITIPATFNGEALLNGKYVLQYGWKNYRNCATLNVVSPGEGVILDEGTVPADVVSCVGYCADYQSSCAGIGSQYADYADCLTKCARFPMGLEDDIIGNTLYCRAHHLHVEGGAATEHCPHASFESIPGKCVGGEPMKPAIVVEVTAQGTPDEVKQALADAFATANPGSTVQVTEDSTAGSYVVAVQFASQGQADAYNYNPETFGAVLDMSALNGATYNVVGAGLKSAETVSTNTIAAAVTLPIFLLAVFGGLFVGRESVKESITSKINVEEDVLVMTSLGMQAVSVVLLIALMASADWAVAGPGIMDTTFGLFNYCSLGECIGMGEFAPESADVIRAVQAFVVLSFLANLFGAGMAGAFYLNRLEKNEKTLSGIAGLAAGTTVFVFLGLCLYAAFYFDVIKIADPTASMGWAFDLMGVYWLISLISFGVNYRLYLSKA